MSGVDADDLAAALRTPRSAWTRRMMLAMSGYAPSADTDIAPAATS